MGLFSPISCRLPHLAVFWAGVANRQVVRMERGQVPLPVLSGAVVMEWLLQLEGSLQVVPVVVVLWPLDVLVGPDLGCKRRLKPRQLVVRCWRAHLVASWLVEEWLVW